MSGVDELLKKGFVDERNMFVTGCSGGNVKTPTAMIRMNNEWHGTSSTPSNFVRTQLYLRHWFDKYKRGSAVTTTAAPQQ